MFWILDFFRFWNIYIHRIRYLGDGDPCLKTQYISFTPYTHEATYEIFHLPFNFYAPNVSDLGAKLTWDSQSRNTEPVHWIKPGYLWASCISPSPRCLTSWHLGHRGGGGIQVEPLMAGD